MPGFGVCGISGVLLVLASLGLVVYGHWPRTGSEWIRFGNKLGPFGVSLLGSLVGRGPRRPLSAAHPGPEPPHAAARRGAGEEEAEADWPLHAELQGLIGAIGVAATPLRPAGKTQFGDEFVDVVAEGGYIMPGTRVQVIEVEGGRVVVKEV